MNYYQLFNLTNAVLLILSGLAMLALREEESMKFSITITPEQYQCSHSFPFRNNQMLPCGKCGLDQAIFRALEYMTNETV